jgi:hypothetical protein
MPPWPEWQFEYVGSRFLGRLLGLWSRFCVSVIRRLFRLTLAMVIGPRASEDWTDHTANYACDAPRTEPSLLGRVSRMAISTLVTVGVWSAITWKPVWHAAGPAGDKILTVVLLLVSAAWPISLVWIWLSKPQTTISDRKAHTSHYSGSSRAKAT